MKLNEIQLKIDIIDIEVFLKNVVDRNNWVNGNSSDGWFAKRDIIQWAEEILEKLQGEKK